MILLFVFFVFFCFFKQKTAYELRISDWSSDVCSSDLAGVAFAAIAQGYGAAPCPASICTPRSGVPGSTSRLSPWRLESGRSASYDQCEALRAWPLDRLSA